MKLLSCPGEYDLKYNFERQISHQDETSCNDIFDKNLEIISRLISRFAEEKEGACRVIFNLHLPESVFGNNICLALRRFVVRKRRLLTIAILLFDLQLAIKMLTVEVRDLRYIEAIPGTLKAIMRSS